MSWLSNANTIASLIMAIIGIGGFVYGAASYLLRKAHSTRQDLGSSTATTSTAQISSIPYRPLSWLEWIEMFGYGLIDTADFVFSLFPDDDDIKDLPVIGKVGTCLFICGLGVIGGEIVLGLSLGWFLSVLGMSNAPGAAIAITTILLFMTFSLLYIYHVGLRVEMKQYERYQEVRQQSPARQE